MGPFHSSHFVCFGFNLAHFSLENLLHTFPTQRTDSHLFCSQYLQSCPFIKHLVANLFQKQRTPAFKEIQVPNNCAKFSKGEDSVCLFLPVVALAELVSMCFVQILEFSPLQRMSKTTGRDGLREKCQRSVVFLIQTSWRKKGPDFGMSVVTWVHVKTWVKLEWLFCARGSFALEMPSWKGQCIILFIIK